MRLSNVVAFPFSVHEIKCLRGISFDNPHHQLSIREVTLEHMQGARAERQVQAQLVEEASRVVEVVLSEMLISLPKPNFQKRVLPLDVEEHKTVNVDDNRMAVSIH